MKRFVFPLAAALCFVVLVSHHSTVSAKDTWISVKTKNLHLIGNANEKEIRKVALKLEQFREVFTRLVPHLKYDTDVGLCSARAVTDCGNAKLRKCEIAEYGNMECE